MRQAFRHGFFSRGCGLAAFMIRDYLNWRAFRMEGAGKILLMAGLAIAALGLLLMFGPKIPWLGRLPGDILIRRGNTTFYFPVVTCIILSVVITVLARLFGGK